VRASVGRFGDDRAGSLDDAALVERVHAELRAAIGANAHPVATRVSRWERAFPQFAPGHLARMGTMHAALERDAPHVAVAGAAINGVGIPTVIGSARAAVARLDA
jgi:oxygen-dependent protoporphyrinogen oxidase